MLGLFNACDFQSILEMMQAMDAEPRAGPGIVAAVNLKRANRKLRLSHSKDVLSVKGIVAKK
jgi:hypothetical protein